MKVKIGQRIFDSSEEPIAVVFSKADKFNISNMHPTARVYCSFPPEKEAEDIHDFIRGLKNLAPD